ncbi:hypothetical protein [Streptomyces sp. NPDC090026]|uniref:hypothetical protein n=1 Tax=Streptomyces sp. NPDC090026 TaxID=3365923 RepID=UPI0038287C6F
MSAAVRALGVLGAAVHVIDPETRTAFVIGPGEEVTDPAIAQQITNPRCWKDCAPARPAGSRGGKKPKATDD